MNRTTAIALLWTLQLAGIAAAQTVMSVSFSQDANAPGWLQVHYWMPDLNANVSLELSLDGGSSFTLVPAEYTSGDVGEVAAGNGSAAINIQAWLGSLYCTNAVVRVLAEHTAPEGMVLMPPAAYFVMGRTGVAEPVHAVYLTEYFYLGRSEVTNEEYLEALQWALEQGLVIPNASGGRVVQYGQILLVWYTGVDNCEIRYDSPQFVLHEGTFSAQGRGPGAAYPNGYDPATHPVMHVTWYGAACYCDWRSQLEGLTPYYNGQWSQIPDPGNPYAAEGYRLPTEAEWEYAAQYNDRRLYPWGDTVPTPCLQANYGNCARWTAPVGSYPAGDAALGLHDLAGNVWEWCNDWFAAYPNANYAINPAGPSQGGARVARGGCHSSYSHAGTVSCAFRYNALPGNASEDLGFRICRTVAP